MGLFKNTIKIIWLFALAFVSCVDGDRNDKGTLTSKDATSNTRGTIAIKKRQTENIPHLQYFYNKDSRNGMVTERIPFPVSWKQHDSGEYAFTGPNGIKVYGEGGRYFSYSNDPMMVDLYQKTGINVKYPITMDQSIEEFLMPSANSVNRKMVKKYPIPQLLEGYKNFSGMIFKQEQNPTQFDATAIEWLDPDGTRWVTVFFYQLEQGQNNVLWGFQAGAVGAPEAYFEQAKQDYLNGILNKQINPQWINTMNQQTQYTIRKGEEAHARRQAEFKANMQYRQQQWEANQETIINRQKQWEANQDAISLQNEHVSDVILGKVNIIDPNSGIKSKIDNNNNRYWVNSQNKYIGTDTSYDDPNKNSYLNGETWREFEIDDYRK